MKIKETIDNKKDEQKKKQKKKITVSLALLGRGTQESPRKT